MGLFSRLFSGYVGLKGNIIGASDHHKHVSVKVLVSKDDLKNVFTGDVKLEELSGRSVRLHIPKIRTRDTKKEDLERLKKQKLRELRELERKS